jgi:hypothetical protein
MLQLTSTFFAKSLVERIVNVELLDASTAKMATHPSSRKNCAMWFGV